MSDHITNKIGEYPLLYVSHQDRIFSKVNLISYLGYLYEYEQLLVQVIFTI